MSHITTFFAPKTAGNTVLALNTAILAQHERRNQKILLWQLTQYPDLHIYAGLPDTKHWGQLIDFIGSKEFTRDLIPKVTINPGVDMMLSPAQKHWDTITVSKWQKILALLESSYDQIIMDLHESVPKKIRQTLLQSSEKIILTTLVDPASLITIKNWFEAQDFAIQQKCKLIANQCPSDSMSEIRKKLNLASLPLLTAVPLASKGLWEQIYQGFPLVFQKRNKWKKSLLKLAECLS